MIIINNSDKMLQITINGTVYDVPMEKTTEIDVDYSYGLMTLRPFPKYDTTKLTTDPTWEIDDKKRLLFFLNPKIAIPLVFEWDQTAPLPQTIQIESCEIQSIIAPLIHSITVKSMDSNGNNVEVNTYYSNSKARKTVLAILWSKLIAALISFPILVSLLIYTVAFEIDWWGDLIYVVFILMLIGVNLGCLSLNAGYLKKWTKYKTYPERP
ncbi:MAG: hypothetical protein E7630_01555 [Ruminococcaceae bacterium]|nr:hypothetical protein [Oscillospiraceae bacterium]